MSQQNTSPATEPLIIAGIPLPLGGTTESWRITYPPVANAQDVLGGGSIHADTTHDSAVLTIQCHVESVRHQTLLGLLGRQRLRSSTGAVDPFFGSGTKRGERTTWADATITAQPDTVSSNQPEVVTWTVALTNVRRIVVPGEVLP